MLNAVKQLCRIVDQKEIVKQRTRSNALEIFHYFQHKLRLSLNSGFQYSVLLICLLLASTSQAQTYPIKTLDGANTAIKIRYRTTSIPFTISCSTDKMILPNYWAGGEIKILNRKFLEIKYRVRGGSGVGIGNTLLLCISRGKLRQVMHIDSYCYNLEDEKTTTHYTQLLLDTANAAHATIYDTIEFKRNSRPTSVSIKKSIIKFNTTQRVFCNYQKKITTILGSYNYKTNQVDERHFAGIVPAFWLDGCEYVFISGRWYGTGGDTKRYFLIE